MEESSGTAITLAGGHKLVVEQQVDSNVIKLLASDGQLTLSIRITSSGPVLIVEGGSLAIEATGDLALAANRVAIHARDGLSLTSGGDAHFHATGDWNAEARTHNITASLGNVNLKANDDIRLNGERVMVNC